MNKTAITIKNLTKDFKTVRALNGLSLDVPEGIVFGYLDPNGSGKTTTLRLLLGLLEPNGGEAHVQDTITVCELERFDPYRAHCSNIPGFMNG